MTDDLAALRAETEAAIAGAADPRALEAVRVAVLGKSGSLTALLKGLGAVAPEAVAIVARALDEMGCYEVSLGDTIGTGTPAKAQAMIAAVAQHIPVERLGAHFHDTYGQALANLLAVMQMGVAVID